MEDIRLYKFKNKYLNCFFWQNNVFFLKAKDVKNKINFDKLDNKKIFIFDDKIKDIKNDKNVRKLALSIIENLEKPDYLYTDMRLNFSFKSILMISQKMNIAIKPIDSELKNSLIVYNYYKFKELLDKQGFDTFYKQYKLAGINETQEQVIKHNKCNIIDYFYIVTLKNIIRIYTKEIDSCIDVNNPPFTDKMIFKYLDNYFSKIAIIVYNNQKVKNFISNYFITDIQSDDMISSFIDDLLSFYKIVTNNTFEYENKYKYNIKNFTLFNTKKAKNIKNNNFSIYFDKIMEEKNNYKNFMFMLEILEFNSYISDKKKIINYISILELMLVNGNSNISKQLQNKCIKLLKSGNYTMNEIKLAYDYRSKLIHGEYEQAINKLRQLSLNNNYKFTIKELDDEIYLNNDQMIEQRLAERLYKLLTVILKYFIFKNKIITNLKIG